MFGTLQFISVIHKFLGNDMELLKFGFFLYSARASKSNILKV